MPDKSHFGMTQTTPARALEPLDGGGAIGELFHTITHVARESIRVHAKTAPDLQKTMLTYIRLSRSHEHLWTFLFTFQAGPKQKAPEWYNEKIALVFEQIELALTPYTATKKQAREAARIIWSSIHGMCVL
jgi:hypothetical protein